MGTRLTLFYGACCQWSSFSLGCHCLRVLSKTWDRYVTPGFTKAFAEVSPKPFALVSQENRNPGNRGLVGTRIYDTKAKRWHHFRHQTVVEETRETGDGGLVCIVSIDRDK